MQNKKYFYLDGAEKKGPFSIEEIKELQLSDDTLIYSDVLNKWIPFKDFDDFRENTELENGDKKNKTDGKRLKSRNILVFFVLLFFSAFVSYYLTLDYKKKDFLKLEEKINNIFNGKDEICDFTRSGVKGKLEKVKKGDSFFNKKDNEGNDLYEYFTCELGGWTVLSLKKLNNGYDLIEMTSTDMGFKVPESIWENLGYGSGYYSSTHRGSVQNAYNEAMKFLSVESENKSYVAGSYNKIISFHELYSAFHHIENVDPTRFSDASANLKTWKSEPAVYNSNWIVWCKQKGKHYEIVLDKKKYSRKLLVNMAIAIVIAILIYDTFVKKRL